MEKPSKTHWKLYLDLNIINPNDYEKLVEILMPDIAEKPFWGLRFLMARYESKETALARALDVEMSGYYNKSIEVEEVTVGNQPQLPIPKENQPTTPEFKPGDLVICTYRLPCPNQPWIAPFWVGTIEEPGDSIEKWNGRNSEHDYCEHTKKARVRYSAPGCESFVQWDHLDSLRRITAEQAALPKHEKIRLFVGEEAYQNLLRSK